MCQGFSLFLFLFLPSFLSYTPGLRCCSSAAKRFRADEDEEAEDHPDADDLPPSYTTSLIPNP